MITQSTDVLSPSRGGISSRALATYMADHWALLLGVFTLLSRMIYTSSPYYVDGPLHVQAISSGSLFIQPPGYLLYAEIGRLVIALLHISPALALHLINIVASAVGTFIFAKLLASFYEPKLAMALAMSYAFSDVIWFVSDIHSTYALSAALVVALLYLCRRNEAGWLIGLVWAMQAGIRPSEGVFILPFMLIIMLRRGRKQILQFTCVAIPVITLWYVPTAQHFGGGPLSPLRSASGQAVEVANGLLTHVSGQRKVANLIHLSCSVFNGWNVLALPMILGPFYTKNSWMRSLVWLLAPGLAFYILVFFSDPAYLAYLVAPGLLLAGESLSRLSTARSVTFVMLASSISISQMSLWQPIAARSTTTAVLDSYVLEYTGWSIRHRYVMRLDKAMRDLSGNR